MTIADIKIKNKQAGKHYFDKDTMRFWGSKIYPYVYKGNYFIDARDNFDRSAKVYTVCQAQPDGSIKVGIEFLPEYALATSLNEAKNMIKTLQTKRNNYVF